VVICCCISAYVFSSPRDTLLSSTLIASLAALSTLTPPRRSSPLSSHLSSLHSTLSLTTLFTLRSLVSALSRSRVIISLSLSLSGYSACSSRHQRSLSLSPSRRPSLCGHPSSNVNFMIVSLVYRHVCMGCSDVLCGTNVNVILSVEFMAGILYSRASMLVFYVLLRIITEQ